MERLSRMSPADRRKALAGLPPWQQKLISTGVERLDQLTPAAREQWLTRFRRFQELSPRQKSAIRRMVVEFRGLPVNRRAAVKSELDALSRMTESQRAQRLASEDFRTRFEPRERQIIEAASQVLPDI